MARYNELKYWHELTPAEMVAKHRIVQGGPGERQIPESLPFTGPRLPLDGYKALSYQLGLSDLSRCLEARLQRAAHPDLPSSGDKRSGVLILDGETVVGSFVLDGQSVDSRFRMAVAKDYQRRGLAKTMMLLWGSKVKRLVDGGARHPISQVALDALLAVHAELIRRAA